MNRALMYPWPLLLLQACGLLSPRNINRQSEKLHLEEERTDTQLGRNLLSENSEALHLQVDSGAQTYEVLLWPEGPFTFSPEKGFSGKAKKIAISGAAWQNSSQLSQERHQRQTDSLVISQKEQSLKLENKQLQIQKQVVSVWWWAVGFWLVAAAYLAWRFRPG